MSTKKVAELLVETLALAGVKRIYGVAGDSLNGITDSIRTTGRYPVGSRATRRDGCICRRG